MNRDFQEQKIRQLFRKLREEEQKITPAFSTFVAPSRRTPSSSKPYALRLAFSLGVMMMIIGGIYWLNPFQNGFNEKFLAGLSAKEIIIQVTPEMAIQMKQPETTPQITAAQRPTKPQPVRHRISRPEEWNVKTLTAWHSPTAALLKIPGDEWLKILPRIESPKIDFNKLIPNEKN
ncbi:MAG: hypothetical protein AB1757_11415 [Acidobacteriota bacterium]